DDPAGGGLHTESPFGRDGISAQDHNRAGPHVLLFADDSAYAASAVVGEGVSRMFKQSRDGARLRRRHRRWQIHKPPRVHSEAAHSLERRGRVLLAHRHLSRETRGHNAFAHHVLELKQLVMALLRRQPRGVLLRSEERTGRLVIGVRRRDADELLLRVAECGERAAEHTARVDIDRVVEPLGLADGRVPVNDHCGTAVVSGPVQADGKPELVGLAGRVSVEGELAHPARGAPGVLGLHPAMGDDELAVVEHVVADQPVDKLRDPLTELRRLAVKLLDGLSEPVRELYVLAVKLAKQLGLVVTRHADGCATLDHAHDQSKDFWRVRAAVHENAEEHSAPSLGRCDADPYLAVFGAPYLITQTLKKLNQFVVAAVNLADDVERTLLVFLVGPETLPRDRPRVNLLNALEGPDVTKSFALEPAQRAPKLLGLLPDDVGTEVAVGSRAVALLRDPLRYVEHNRHG